MDWIKRILAALGLIEHRAHEDSARDFTDAEMEEFWMYFED
jgi:hypothetical protein